MGDLQSRQNSKLLAAVYIILFAVAAVGDSKFLPSSAKAAAVMTFAIAVMVLMVTADFSNLKTISWFIIIYSVWIFVILFYSLFIWIIRFETASYMMRGCSKLMYQFMLVLCVFAAAYLFGEKGIHYTFYGLVLGNAVIALLYIPVYGISEVISSVTTFVLSPGEAVGYMRSLEIHDITFTYGFFLIYFIFFDKISTKKMKAFNILIAALFFYIGFKRIALISFVFIFAAGLILRKTPPRAQYGIMKTVLVLAVIFSFIYLLIINNDVFIMMMNKFGVDVMGRDVLYGYIDKYYRISPTFFGYGFEYVHMMMLEIAKVGGSQFNGMVDIHNDFLRVYIEMGFWGFIAWGLYTLVFQYSRIKSKFSLDTARLFFLCEMYIFFTYMTDNTLFYFFSGMVLRMIPACYALHRESPEKAEILEGKPVDTDDKKQKGLSILSQ